MTLIFYTRVYLHSRSYVVLRGPIGNDSVQSDNLRPIICQQYMQAPLVCLCHLFDFAPRKFIQESVAFISDKIFS